VVIVEMIKAIGSSSSKVAAIGKKTHICRVRNCDLLLLIKVLLPCQFRVFAAGRSAIDNCKPKKTTLSR
jgi:hypothetical protein